MNDYCNNLPETDIDPLAHYSMANKYALQDHYGKVLLRFDLRRAHPVILKIFF